MAYRGGGKKKFSAQVAFDGGADTTTLTGNLTLDEKSANFQRLDPGGSSRDVTLPAEEQNSGLFFVFMNAADAAENLVIKNDAGSTVITLNRGESCIVAVDDDGAWSVFHQSAAAFSDFGSDGIKSDVVAESTSAAGVTVDGLLIKDGFVLALDDQGVKFGTGLDIVGAWDGTRFNWTQATANSEMRYGVDGAGIDQMWYGDTASAYLNWDQSADVLIFGGVASARGLRTSSATAAAITGATALTLADSGGVFSVSQAAAYDIDLPSPTSGPGCRYVFYLTGPAANNVTITVLGGAATFVGTIVNEVTSVIPATGSTLTFASGAAALGDTIEIISISTTLYLVRAVTSAAGGITVA